MEVNQIDQWK